MYLSPLPTELIPLASLEGINACYAEIYCNITDKAYKATGIDGFLSHDLFQGFKIDPKPMMARATSSVMGDNIQSPQIIPSLSLTHMLTTGRSMRYKRFSF